MNRASHLRPLALALVAGLGLGLTACKATESRSAPENGTTGAVSAAPTVPAGASMTFTVDDQVTADGYRPGDRFTATLGTDATGVDGKVVLPSGTKSHWLVTEALSDGMRTVLAARLEAVQVGEDWYPVQATVTQAELGAAGAKSAAGQPAETVKTGAEADSLIATMREGLAKPDTTAMTANDMTGRVPAALVAVMSDARPATIEAGSRITVRLSSDLAIGPDGQEPGTY